MYEQFTDRAKKAMQLAGQAGERYRKKKISPSMICLGVLQALLLHDTSSQPLQTALATLGLQRNTLFCELRKRMGEGIVGTFWGRLDPDEAAKDIIAASHVIAERMGKRCVNPEHLFLALFASKDEMLREFFAEYALTAERVKEALPKQEVLVS